MSLIGVFILSAVATVYSSMREYRLHMSSMTQTKEEAVMEICSGDGNRQIKISLRCIVKCILLAKCESVLMEKRRRSPQLTTAPVYRADLIGPQHDSSNMDDKRREEPFCHKGKCLCGPGPLYSPSANACIQCDELGQTFSHHPELGIIGNNQEVYKFTKSIEECEKLCLMSANFTCMSAEYMNMTSFFGGHECYLSTVTYMNVSIADRTVDSHGWILTERECL